MRSMANNIAGLFLFIALALPFSAHALAGSLEIVEPPLDKHVGWMVNEIPANVTIYYDVDGDKKADIVFAHPILYTNNGVNCHARILANEYYWVFSTCPGDNATDYFVFKQWTLYKFMGGQWQRVFQFIDKYGRFRTCRIQSSQQILGDQDIRRAKKSCSGN